ncbi:hypothetical protein P43SY_007492 [Pythium insidiosum]|uniref:Prolyl 4-hydroxylase alpha subunit domain-containing protein n=1 Tax=Pythium insidiosum TaxID=114742 RepID=A0AAD5LVY1_PYTIN|nr:hypothetical protein P43SY_007492 [Pythium insidiosum]
MADETHAVLTELNDFSSAPAALEKIFSACDDDKLKLLEQLVVRQNAAPNATLGTVLERFHRLSESPAVVRNDMLFLVMGKPGLLFATSIYDEDLALLIWRGLVRFHERHPQFDLLAQLFNNTRDSHGLSALHYAVEAQMHELVAEITQWLSARSDQADRFRRLVYEVRTQDVVLPISKTHVSGKSIATGGATLVHLAAKLGDVAFLRALLDPPVSCEIEKVGRDWDDLTPLEVALLHRRSEATSILLEHQTASLGFPTSEDALTALQEQRDSKATARYIDSMVAKPPMTEPHTFPSIWTAEECQIVTSALEEITSRRGWNTQRHTSYPTTDLPCYQATPIDAWVRMAVATRLFPQILEHYRIDSGKQCLTFRELFFVKYEAQVGEQAELGLHCDGSVLSFNILLNPSSEFQAGKCVMPGHW